MSTKNIKIISILVPSVGLLILLIPLFMYLANIAWTKAYETFMYIILSVSLFYAIYDAIFNFKLIKSDTDKALFYVTILLEFLTLVIAIAILVYVMFYELYY